MDCRAVFPFEQHLTAIILKEQGRLVFENDNEDLSLVHDVAQSTITKRMSSQGYAFYSYYCISILLNRGLTQIVGYRASLYFINGNTALQPTK